MNDSSIQQLFDLVNTQSLFGVIKVLLVLGYGLYFVFAAVGLVQIKRMFQTISTGAELLFQTLGWGHLILSLVALVWAIVVI